MAINYQGLPPALVQAVGARGLSRFVHNAYRSVRTGSDEPSALSMETVKRRLFREMDFVVQLAQYPEDGGQVFTATVVAMPASEMQTLLLAAYNAGKEDSCSGT